MPSLSELEAQAASFDADIAKAVANRVIPGVVLMAENKTGSFTYEKVLGLTSLEPGHEIPVHRDSVFQLMSMTKLATALVCLQAVERGLVDLDADVAPRLPELAALPVLDGFDDATGTPRLTPRTRPITLRLLLTHSAGTAYSGFCPAIGRYHTWHKAQTPESLAAVAAAAGLTAPLPPAPVYSTPPSSVETYFCDPLVFQPGEGFQYGCGLDWAGRLMERLHSSASGTPTTLEDLVARDIVAPLGLPPGALTFYLGRFADVAARLWPTQPRRDAPGQPVRHAPAPDIPKPGEPEGGALGGQGLAASMPAYAEILRSLLRDDGRLLRPGATTAGWLTAPQLGSERARAQLRETCATGDWIVGNVPRDTNNEYDWSLVGLVVTGSSHPQRRPGAVTWAGVYNLTWVVDRAAGLWTLFGTNFAPNGDAEGNALMGAFEAHVYAEVAKL